MISPTCVTVTAKELSAGDWVAYEGYVMFAHRWKGQIQVCVGSTVRILDPEERVSVHIEDHGEEG